MDDLQREEKKAGLTFTYNRHDNSICGTMGRESLFAVAEIITETPFVAATTQLRFMNGEMGGGESLADKFARPTVRPTDILFPLLHFLISPARRR